MDKCVTVPIEPYTPPQPNFVPIRVAGKLFCEFDAKRGILRWKHRDEVYLVDLTDYGNSIAGEIAG